ncbi:MAG: ABC transporter ATP-binding protein, partial [bacterium]|nr:ABC transporter ATP-binding protein [bacterium]
MPANRNKKFEKAKDFKSAIKRLLKELNPFKALVILSLTLSVAASILSIATPNILSKLTDKISNGIVPNKENLVRINNEISSNFASGNAKDIEIDGVVISTTEQSEYLNVIKDIDKNAKVNELYSKIDEFPDTIKSLIKPSMDLSGITRISVFIGCLYLISAIFNYIESISMTIVSNKFAKKLRSSISSKINKLPLKYFDKNRTGDTLSRVTNDIDTVAQSMDNSLSTLVSASALFIGTLIMMFVTNALMAVTAILSSMIGFAFMFFVLGKSQKYFEAKQRELGNLNSHIEEVYSSLNVVKAYNGKELSDKKFDELNNKLYNANRKSQFLSGLMPPMMHFIGNFGYVAVCIVGALLTMNNVISFGVIIAFISYVRLFTSPLSQIAQSVSSLQTIAAASERVFEFIDEKEMKDESNLVAYLNKDKVTGNIEFDNVVFRYDGNDTDTIKNFSAKIKSGSKIAIVGPTGAGKTTIVNLLMKFYDITSGDIKIDGVSINDLKRENVHDLFTMVLQDTWVYEGTIKDNIIYNNSSVGDKDVEDVCKVVGLDHFIKTFSDGYNTMLVNNESVSAGQRQLLTIARGMLKNAPFLILDEATSNVDTRTEELVQNAMDKLAEGKTSFIIAHRLSTIKNADLILVMRDGNIVEQGNHDK